MRKTIVCIFAHPDDEAFGPAGTIAKLTKENDVYILCATKGEAGQNNHDDLETPLQSLRAQEMKNSAKILGVKKVVFLGFHDGTLSNNRYHKLAAAITKYLEKLKPTTLLTFEPRGVSGHIDHVTVSMVSTFVFYKLPYVQKLYYYCLSTAQRDAMKFEYFIYFPPGYSKEISKSIDISDVWEQKLEAMHQHKSQRSDISRVLSIYKDLPKQENFIILEK